MVWPARLANMIISAEYFLNGHHKPHVQFFKENNPKCFRGKIFVLIDTNNYFRIQERQKYHKKKNINRTSYQIKRDHLVLSKKYNILSET